jgi:uncharacterized protein YndB with AHSA1/START domain
MAIKKDATGRRWVEMEFIAPATPEDVWKAMATGAGNTAWFTRATIDERVGGVLRFDFGPSGTSSGEVTTWEPPHRFGYVEREWSEGAPPVATEITITSRTGGQCVVRMVHSLFSSSDAWDDQMEGFENGWPAFFEVLRIYLRHFAGRPAQSFVAMNQVEGDHLSVWKRLTEELGLSNPNVGEPRIMPARPQALSGVIERVQQDAKQRVIVLRLETPVPGVAMIGAYDAGTYVNASLSFFFYGDDADAAAAASEPVWRAWLGEAFRPVATSK